MTSDHPGDPAAGHPDRQPVPEEGPMDETTTTIDETTMDDATIDDNDATDITGTATATAGDGAVRHRGLDHTSLVAGVVVLLIAAAFAFGDPDSLRDQGRLMGPLVLLGIGAALLIGSLRR
jgi:hypothetical protein